MSRPGLAEADLVGTPSAQVRYMCLAPLRRLLVNSKKRSVADALHFVVCYGLRERSSAAVVIYIGGCQQPGHKGGDGGNFTPISGLIGGLLIGLAATLLLLLNGRISGISGIVGGLLAPKSSDAGWRMVFVADPLLGAYFYMLATGGPLPVRIQSSVPMLAVAGL
jgi:hypothetical protein